MPELKFSNDHEWVFIDEDGNAVIGITDFAQKELGDIVYVELPEIGREVGRDEEAAVVESVKAASDVKMPISGKVVAVNEVLTDSPELINTAPETDGWFLKLAPDAPEQLDSLMDADAYTKFTEQAS